MTKVRVNSGNCGYSVMVTAEKGENRTVHISLDTDCEMVMNMHRDIAALDMRTLFTSHLVNPVYCSAARHLKHVACPVPAAILKAAEVELGFCVAEDVAIVFEGADTQDST
jgi:hypothetical protein